MIYKIVERVHIIDKNGKATYYILNNGKKITEQSAAIGIKRGAIVGANIRVDNGIEKVYGKEAIPTRTINKNSSNSKKTTFVKSATVNDLQEFDGELLGILLGQGNRVMSIISDLLKKQEDGTLFVFDWDGTLTSFKYAKNSLLPCRDDEIYEYSKTKNIYKDVRILKYMQYIIKQLKKENVFVLTRTELTLVEKKNEAIHKHFDILQSHIFHVQDANNKLAVLKRLHDKTGKKIVFFEDTFKTILNSEETYSFVEGFHISMLSE